MSHQKVGAIILFLGIGSGITAIVNLLMEIALKSHGLIIYVTIPALAGIALMLIGSRMIEPKKGGGSSSR